MASVMTCDMISVFIKIACAHEKSSPTLPVLYTERAGVANARGRNTNFVLGLSRP